MAFSYFVGSKHYSEVIIDKLAEGGWTKKDAKTAEKRYVSGLSGELSDGNRIAYAQFCERQRYLELVVGWESPVCIDCRGADPDEVVAELNAKAKDILG